ncbi:MAG: hypothetical protein JXX29_13060 [Deltaproteobacteria bacterium]|nr:hypothetical protein [Deltaproteobacteria bacterium]MBN2672607.1 hypothetical protein [Deltaproteobacteria bacterium]
MTSRTQATWMIWVIVCCMVAAVHNTWAQDDADTVSEGSTEEGAPSDADSDTGNTNQDEDTADTQDTQPQDAGAENSALQVRAGTAEMTGPGSSETQTDTASVSVDAKSDDGNADERDRGFLHSIKKKPDLKLRAQLAALWQLQDDMYEPTNEFLVNRARIKFSWEQGDAVEAVVKVEAKELFRGNTDDSILRDLYIRVQPVRWLGLRVGQFKKPFSGMALTSWSAHPFVERGISNDYIIDHLLYGGRDIGAMLEGRLVESIKLDYALGVFNGMGMNANELGFAGSKDVVARLELEPVKWLDIGANGSFKFIERQDLIGYMNQDNFDMVQEDEYPNGYSALDFQQEYDWMARWWWMSGLDVKVTPKKWRIAAEGMFGRNWWFFKYRYLWSGALEISYKKKVKKGVSIWLEPGVRADVLSFLNTDLSGWRTRMWQIVPGVNVHIGKYVRLMLNGEFIIAQGTEADIDGSRRDGLWPEEYPGAWTDAKRFMLQLAFDR